MVYSSGIESPSTVVIQLNAVIVPESSVWWGVRNCQFSLPDFTIVLSELWNEIRGWALHSWDCWAESCFCSPICTFCQRQVLDLGNNRNTENLHWVACGKDGRLSVKYHGRCVMQRCSGCHGISACVTSFLLNRRNSNWRLQEFIGAMTLTTDIREYVVWYMVAVWLLCGLLLTSGTSIVLSRLPLMNKGLCSLQQLQLHAISTHQVLLLQQCRFTYVSKWVVS